MKLDEKENIIYLLKKDIERLNSNKEKVYKEVFIVEPSKISMILNNELNFTRDILAKISKIVNVEKNKKEKLEEKLKVN